MRLLRDLLGLVTLCHLRKHLADPQLRRYFYRGWSLFLYINTIYVELTESFIPLILPDAGLQ